MKRSAIVLVAATALMVALLLYVLFSRRAPVPFSAGTPLPAGVVTPKLVNTWDAAVLLAPDGSLWTWGGTQFQLAGLSGGAVRAAVPTKFGGNQRWRDVAASHVHVVALRDDGTLWGLGANVSGVLTQPNPTNVLSQFVLIDPNTNWLTVSAGLTHMLALKTDGSLWAWGQNDHGQVGDGTKSNQFAITQIGSDRDWQTIAAGAFNSFALKRDGTIWGWGLDPVTAGKSDLLSPQLIDSDSNWVAISAGDYCVLGLKSDRTLWLRGQNAHVILPNAIVGSTATFLQVGSDSDWTEIYAGQSYFFARKADRSWWVCGHNYNGELGFFSTRPVSSPQRWQAEMDPWAFAPGYGTTLLLAKDGTLWTWGARLGVPNRNNFLNPLLRRVGMPGFGGSREDHSPQRLWQFQNSAPP